MGLTSMNPQAMKQVNMANIRNTLRAVGSATRAQLARHINVSTTTVRSLLCEMQAGREILVAGIDASSGGRRAERYQLNPHRFCGAAFCVGGGLVGYRILNLFGQASQEGSFPFAPGNLEDEMAAVLQHLAPGTLRAVCVGVPGVVTQGGYTVESHRGEWEKYALGAKLQKHFGAAVVLENDLNLITMGMGCCHRQTFPKEAPQALDMAYLHFEAGCISAGFLCGGRLVRGFSNYAGELGMMPASGGLSLAQKLGAAKGADYAEIVASIAEWVILILNPHYITFGGPAFRKQAMGVVSDILCADMPREALPELLYAEDTRHDYNEGLAALCTDQIFLAINSGFTSP